MRGADVFRMSARDCILIEQTKSPGVEPGLLLA